MELSPKPVNLNSQASEVMDKANDMHIVANKLLLCKTRPQQLERVGELIKLQSDIGLQISHMMLLIQNLP